MTKRTIAAGLCVLFAAAGPWTGCGDDDEGGGGGGPNPLAVIATASDVSVLSVLALQAGSLGPLAFPDFGPGPRFAFAPADTFFPPPLLCPMVSATGDSLGDSMTFDFGNGCVSTMDGQLTAGLVAFEAGTNTLGNGLRFSSADLGGFSRNGRTVLSGELAVEERGMLLDVDIPFTAFSQGSVDGSLSGSFTAGPSGDPADPYYCRTWKIGEGSGTATFGGLDYAFSVLDTLVVSTCCGFPLQGSLTVVREGRTPAFFDFGNGTCDSLAVLTIGGEKQTIVLGY
jgi:hypothetical protein